MREEEGYKYAPGYITHFLSRYVFTAVAGADHKVRASHPTWRFTKDTASVVITDNNGRADDLVVAGFDVRGQVWRL